MKAISLWQPWASLVVCGAKKIETRSWETKVRGTVAIHAAKTEKGLDAMNSYTFADAVGDSLNHLIIYDDRDFCWDFRPTFGCILGTVDIVDCLQVTKDTFVVLADSFPYSQLSNGQIVEGKEFLFGDYTLGRYAWILDNPVMFDKPIPAIGRQGFWNWEETL